VIDGREGRDVVSLLAVHGQHVPGLHVQDDRRGKRGAVLFHHGGEHLADEGLQREVHRGPHHQLRARRREALEGVCSRAADVPVATPLVDVGGCRGCEPFSGQEPRGGQLEPGDGLRLGGPLVGEAPRADELELPAGVNALGRVADAHLPWRDAFLLEQLAQGQRASPGQAADGDGVRSREEGVPDGVPGPGDLAVRPGRRLARGTHDLGEAVRDPATPGGRRVDTAGKAQVLRQEERGVPEDAEARSVPSHGRDEDARERLVLVVTADPLRQPVRAARVQLPVLHLDPAADVVGQHPVEELLRRGLAAQELGDPPGHVVGGVRLPHAARRHHEVEARD